MLKVSRGERIFRGMVGLGTVFGLVGGALIGALSLWTLVRFGGQVDWDDDADFMIVAPFVAFGIAFVLGMLYAGLLALVARGRSFRELSIARVALAGAAIGIVPAVVAIVGGTLNGAVNVLDDAVNALLLFPPASAIVATATLLIARRAAPEPEPVAEVPGEE
jgi:hypothetical protein